MGPNLAKVQGESHGQEARQSTTGVSRLGMEFRKNTKADVINLYFTATTQHTSPGFRHFSGPPASYTTERLLGKPWDKTP